jgi:DNA-binding transcriptional ArsR family regulator
VDHPRVAGQARRTLTLLPADTGGVEMVAKFFRALGDPTRLRLLEYLLREPHTVGECVTQVGLAQGRVSSHLACLADCGYVTARRDGRRTFYQVTDPRVADLILAARALAADNAAALAACVRIDTPAARSGGDR